METFVQIIDAIGSGVPGWLPLIFVPALLVVAAILMTLLGGRRLYGYLAAVLGGIGFFLVLCIADTKTAFVFAGFYVTLAALLRLLFFIPCARTFRKSSVRKEREEKIYNKFRQSLGEQTDETELKALPERCAYEEQMPVATAEESGMRLQHVTDILTRLKKEELSAADRLEVDALSRSIEAFRNKALTEEEMCVLNDCLAAVLKLTAKYKL